MGATAWDAYSPRPLTDGERWTAEALSDLRQARYSPMAWVRFISAAYERSVRNREERPRMARQAHQWEVVGAGAWLLAAMISRRHPRASLRIVPSLFWWAAVSKMLDWHLGMAEGGDGRHRERLSPADMVTLTRFWMVPLLVGARETHSGLPVLVALGGASDWLDGVIARKHGRTRLGRDLDTMADMAFLCAAASAANAAGRLPRLAAGVIAVRYGIGISVALIAVFGRARRPAIRARPVGAVLRIGGLTLATAGFRRLGTAFLVTGCLVPPRSTAPRLSPV